MKAQFIDINDLYLSFKSDAKDKEKYTVGKWYEIKEISAAYDRYLKLNGLWRLFLKTCSEETGDSKEYWAYHFKVRSGFGIMVDNMHGNGSIFSPYSFSFSDTTEEERSNLIKSSIMYVFEEGIFDISKFVADYADITKRNLLTGELI